MFSEQSATQNGHSSLPIDHRMVETLEELAGAVDDSACARNLTALAGRIADGAALAPQAYSIYFQLIRAIQSTDQTSTRSLVSALAAAPVTEGMTIRMLGFEDFGRAGVKSTRADFASDSLLHTQIGIVPVAARPRIHRKLLSALDLIAGRAPDVWKDINDVTVEIVAAFGAPRNMMTFDGCSSLERYGSILINMKRNRTPLLLAETLVHESAHGLLFALSCNEHRVLNPSSERYASPLRIDPRPLDGIYHAVFVLARMFAFVKAVAEHPRTRHAMRQEATRLMDQRRKNFLDGHAVLQKHARLTNIGRSLLDDAYARVMTA